MTQEHDAETVERVAAAMWRAETVDAGTPESVTLCRTPEIFRDMHEANRGKWLKFSRAAIAAMPPREVTVHEAMAALSKAVSTDADYAYGWQSNIAMLMQDEGVSHERANIRACDFLRNAFGPAALTKIAGDKP